MTQIILVSFINSSSVISQQASCCSSSSSLVIGTISIEFNPIFWRFGPIYSDHLFWLRPNKIDLPYPSSHATVFILSPIIFLVINYLLLMLLLLMLILCYMSQDHIKNHVNTLNGNRVWKMSSLHYKLTTLGI